MPQCMLGGRQMGLLILHKINCNGYCYLLNLSMNSSVLKFVLLMFHEAEHELNSVLWIDHDFIYQLSKICIVGWHLEIREANTITDVIKKSTSWLRGAFFHRPKKRMTTHFLSLVKPSPIHFLSHVEKNPQPGFFFFFVGYCLQRRT